MAQPGMFSFTQVTQQSHGVWRDPVGGWVIRVAVVEMVGMVLLLGWRLKSLPPQVPLWFSRPWGEMQLAYPLMLWLLPGITLLSLLVGTIAGGIVLEQEKLAARIWLVAAGLVGFLATMTTIKILLLVS